MGNRCAVEVTLQGGGDIPWERLHVVELRGVEGLSQLFLFRVTLYSPEQVDPAAPLSAQLTLTLRYSDELIRHVSGIVSEFAYVRTISNLRATDGEALYVYQLTLAPKVWQLNLASACRIFNKTGVTTMLSEVLKANGLREGSDFSIPARADKSLAWPGGPRDQEGFRVQYQETDWNFVARIMEEFGLFFYFTHGEGTHQLRVGNAPAHYGKGAPSRLVHGEQVTAFSVTAAMAPEAVRLSDFNPARPTMDLSHVAGAADSRLRLYEPGAGFREEGQMKAMTEVRLEEARAGALQAQGEGDCVGLLPGHTYTLTGDGGHPAATGDFIVTWIEHRAVNASPDDRYAEHSLGYENSFTCIPASVSYRPPRVTPRPTIRGVQTAIVVGLEDRLPDLDPDGRVLVRFHWCKDRSCRLRVGQAVASGVGRGNKRYPRVNDEVLVHFQDGNPDQPVLLGAVYQPSDSGSVYYTPAVVGTPKI